MILERFIIQEIYKLGTTIMLHGRLHVFAQMSQHHTIQPTKRHKLLGYKILACDSIQIIYLGRLTSILISPKMLNFSNRDFPFYEFPEGVNLTMFDEKDQKSTIKSDFAIVFNKTDIIDLQGNVVLTTSTNDTLFTEQLFYDQKKEWLFTNHPVKFRTKDYITNGNGFDSNKNFTNAQVLKVKGRIFVDE